MAIGGGPVTSQERSGDRVVRPEGYLELEGDGGAPSSGKGSFSIVPSSKHGQPNPVSSEDGADEALPPSPGPSDSDEQVPAPAAEEGRRVKLCQPQADRFANPPASLYSEATPPMVAARHSIQQFRGRCLDVHRAACFGANDPDQPVAELTWDEELKDLYRAYQKCVKTQRQR